jgi:hypothetical protein
VPAPGDSGQAAVELVGRVADPDPGFGAFLTLDPGSGMSKKAGSGSGSGIEKFGSLISPRTFKEKSTFFHFRKRFCEYFCENFCHFRILLLVIFAKCKFFFQPYLKAIKYRFSSFFNLN